MEQTTTIIIGLGCVSVAAWTVLFWSDQRVLKLFLAVSVLVHAAVFAIPFGDVMPAGKAAREEMRLVPFTIVQGAEESELDAPLVSEELAVEEMLGADNALAARAEGEEPAAVEPESEEGPIGAVDAELPVIERTDWFAFDEHPGAASYRKELQRTIQRYFEVPPELDERGYEGRIKVWLSLGRDGRLHYAFIDPVMRSEDEAINRLTEANVHKIADRFPPFPEGVKDYDVSFFVIIDYRNLRDR